MRIFTLYRLLERKRILCMTFICEQHLKISHRVTVTLMQTVKSITTGLLEQKNLGEPAFTKRQNTGLYTNKFGVKENCLANAGQVSQRSLRGHIIDTALQSQKDNRNVALGKQLPHQQRVRGSFFLQFFQLLGKKKGEVGFKLLCPYYNSRPWAPFTTTRR